MSDAGIDFNWSRHIVVELSGMTGGGSGKLEATGKTTQYRITAIIDKNIQTAAAVSTLQFYNLAPDTRNSFDRSKTKVQIKAGWDKGPQAGLNLCFKGHVLSAQSNRRGPDIITTVHVQSGREAATTTDIFKTWQGGQPVKTVIQEVAQKMPGITIGSIVGIEGKVPDGGFSTATDAETTLHDLADHHGFSWTVIDDVFQAIGDEQSAGGNITIKPPYLVEANPLLAGARRMQKGVFGRCVFNNALTPGKNFSIQGALNPQCNGTFRMTKLVHHLDCHESASFITDFSGFSRR